jgi:hypothetical protein
MNDVGFWIVFGSVVGVLGVFVILLLVWINSKSY